MATRIQKKPSPGTKVETVIVALVRPLPALKGVDIRTGDPEDTPEFDGEAEEVLTPTLDVYTTSVKVVPELEDEWTCDLHVRLRSQADDETGDVLDDRVTALLNALSFPEDVKPLVNFPLASRPVPDFWLVDIYLTDAPETTKDRYYETQMTFMVKFRPDNGQGTSASAI